MRMFVMLSIALLAPGAAHAQGPPRVGLTMGYPASVGLILHVADRVAVRPELQFSRTSSDDASAFASTSLTIGITGLFYVQRWEGLRTYVAPRFSYGHATSSSPGFGLNVSTLSGFFGAQYALHPRFTVFAEVGADYTTRDGSGLGSSSVNTVNTRTGLGAIFYF